MIAAIFKSVQQLSDPTLRRVVRFGLIGAAVTYVLTVALVWTLLSTVSLFQNIWADWGTDLVLGVLALIIPLLIFPALSTAIMGTKLDLVADATEDRHYPGLPIPRNPGLGETLLTTLRFLGVMLVVNLAVSPLYLLLFLTGLSLGLGLVVNGYLLGREYFDLVALRRLPPDRARLVFRNHLGRLWLAGIIIAGLFWIPVVNLLAPVMATSFMVHVFQSLRWQTEPL